MSLPFANLHACLRCFFQDGPVDSSIEIVPKLVKGAQTPGRQPGTARPGLGTGWRKRGWIGWQYKSKWYYMIRTTIFLLGGSRIIFDIWLNVPTKRLLTEISWKVPRIFVDSLTSGVPVRQLWPSRREEGNRACVNHGREGSTEDEGRRKTDGIRGSGHGTPRTGSLGGSKKIKGMFYPERKWGGNDPIWLEHVFFIWEMGWFNQHLEYIYQQKLSIARCWLNQVKLSSSMLKEDTYFICESFLATFHQKKDIPIGYMYGIGICSYIYHKRSTKCR